MKDFLIENWGHIIWVALIVADQIARLTPTKKDNSIVSILIRIYRALFPNRKKGGGLHSF